MKKGDFVFVYGTLRRGERADLARQQHHFDARYVGEDKICGNIYDLGWYPGAKEVADFNLDGNIIHGDLFKVQNDALCVLLDAYEGYPHLYNRQEVLTEGGRKAWVYTYNGEVSAEALIPSGDWTKRTFKTVQTQFLKAKVA